MHRSGENMCHSTAAVDGERNGRWTWPAAVLSGLAGNPPKLAALRLEQAGGLAIQVRHQPAKLVALHRQERRAVGLAAAMQQCCMQICPCACCSVTAQLRCGSTTAARDPYSHCCICARWPHRKTRIVAHKV